MPRPDASREGAPRLVALKGGGKAGKVWLVGAGPGDPELLTLKALKALQAAEVVVHDRLTPQAIIDLAAPGARRIDVGKRKSRHTLPQDDINLLLVGLARDGLRVVRLKGGDPFVFGRGGEEAEALRAAGIAFEIVPGLSAVIAAPAAAGIPVTHRGVSASFTVVTGHRQRGERGVEWEALARAGGTIIVLMGVAHRGEIADRLIAGGLPADTPVAAVHAATTERQHVVRTTLAELAVTPLVAPATIVIGAVAAYAYVGDIAQEVAERRS